jgi:uncharacterized protein YifN (PemK superfamily)
MALPNAPDRGSIIIVNFELGGGGVGDEMCKPMRPCVVIQNNRLHRARLVTVVPLSTTEPDPVKPWHHLMDHRSFRAWPVGWDEQGTPRWAACDYVTTVSLDRCVHPYRKEPYGRRAYTRVFAIKADLTEIERRVKWCLGLREEEQGQQDP